MADARAKELVDVGDRQFTKRQPLEALWQEIGDNFYSTRAHFTRQAIIGEDFGTSQYDSFPELMRRSLGDSISAMLRPRDRPWFKTVTGEERIDTDVNNRRILEEVNRRMRRRMYASTSNFIGATKQCDHDFVTFGQGVVSCEESEDRQRIFMRPWHLSSVCWLENSTLDIDHAHIKDKMTARQMVRRFGEKKVHQSVRRAAEKEPDKEFNFRIIVMPRDEYDLTSKKRESDDGKKRGGNKMLPYVSCYVDVDNMVILDEAPRLLFPLIIPRWMRLTGSAYAFSPATTIALPDGRLIQQLARILLEAGEKAIDPPVAAEEEAVREANIAAGAITWVAAGDRRIQDLIHPLTINYDLKAGLALRQDLREMLTRSMFIDKLTLPPTDAAKMTAYEVARRLEEWVRQALPLFEPMVVEYNSKLLDAIYAQLEVLGEFSDLPLTPTLRSAEIKWAFESPIQTASNRMVVEKFGEALKLHATGQQMGTESPLNLAVALADAIKASDAPASWIKSDEEMAQEAEAMQQRQMLEAAAQQLGQGAQIAQQVGDAGKALQEGGVLQAPEQMKALPAPPPPDQDPRMAGLRALYGVP